MRDINLTREVEYLKEELKHASDKAKGQGI